MKTVVVCFYARSPCLLRKSKGEKPALSVEFAVRNLSNVIYQLIHRDRSRYRDRRSVPTRVKRFLCTPQRPYRLRGPVSLLSNEYREEER